MAYTLSKALMAAAAATLLATSGDARGAVIKGDVIVIDIGLASQQTGGNWNNVAGADGSVGIGGGSTEATAGKTLVPNLKRHSDGAFTGAGLTVTTVSSPPQGAFAGTGGASVAPLGSIAFASTGVIPTTAQQDLAYFNQGQIILRFTGLNDALSYNLQFMSKIDGTARDPQNWIANQGLGSQQIVLVDPDSAPYVATFAGLPTNGSGVITLSVNTGDAAGASTAHMNAIELTAVPEPGTMLLGLAGLVTLGRRRR